MDSYDREKNAKRLELLRSKIDSGESDQELRAHFRRWSRELVRLWTDDEIAKARKFLTDKAQAEADRQFSTFRFPPLEPAEIATFLCSLRSPGRTP